MCEARRGMVRGAPLGGSSEALRRRDLVCSAPGGCWVRCSQRHARTREVRPSSASRPRPQGCNGRGLGSRYGHRRLWTPVCRGQRRTGLEALCRASALDVAEPYALHGVHAAGVEGGPPGNRPRPSSALDCERAPGHLLTLAAAQTVLDLSGTALSLDECRFRPTKPSLEKSSRRTFEARPPISCARPSRSRRSRSTLPRIGKCWRDMGMSHLDPRRAVLSLAPALDG